ncbi:MAG: hypothetical protein CL627_00305 [Aurantimonas sp.]|uniref:hypothetical protein n=1 Tax=Aurantimonas coralicida TaxID=182270 RepID=UPI000C617284|nr:hypothetical protein [Aurantimonas coralicida]MAY27696.1 hypothetical protein [Aurantimonas sp.]MCD1645142.1 hypothetical protein [Aurantimonas coralicida]MCW7544842.1 hypothetical protein [Aurantimonas litoralis]
MSDDVQDDEATFLDSGNPNVSIVYIDGDKHHVAHSAIGILGKTFPSAQLADDAVHAIRQALDAEDHFRAREVAAEHCYAEDLTAREMSESPNDPWEVLALRTTGKDGRSRTAFVLLERGSGRIEASGFLTMDAAAIRLEVLADAVPSSNTGYGG